MSGVINQRRKAVFEQISNQREESWKYDAQWSTFDELPCAWSGALFHDILNKKINTMQYTTYIAFPYGPQMVCS